jgi:hypothetical protein
MFSQKLDNLDVVGDWLLASPYALVNDRLRAYHPIYLGDG